MYLGAIEYLQVAVKWPIGNVVTLTAVKKTTRDYTNNTTNGYEIKYFHVNSPLPTEGAHVFAPFTTGSSNCYDDNHYLYPENSGTGPAPRKELDGKMYREEYFNSQNTLIKSTDYSYRQAGYDWRLYSIRAKDNYVGYTGQSFIVFGQGACIIPVFDRGNGFPFCVNFQRWSLCFFPAISYFTILDKVETKIYSNGNQLIEKKEFTYNEFSQKEYEITYNSDGTKTKQLTKWPTEYSLNYNGHYYFPSNPTGDAFSVSQMWNAHVYDLPIEQITMKENLTGQTNVLSAIYNVYDKSLLKEAYVLETNTPLLLNTGFTPSEISNYYPASGYYDITKNSKYKLQQSAVYNNINLPKDLISINNKKSFIWDENYNNIIAQCVNSNSGDIAFTSFESGKGNWIYTGIPDMDEAAPTGQKFYNLSNGSISSQLVLDNTKKYIVSYWSKNGDYSVTNGTGLTTGASINGWTYYEHSVNNATSVTISGSGIIDELRLYPEKSQMTTYTYEPLVGVSSICDINNRITYYKYDMSNRLSFIKDNQKNIIKKFEYKYGEVYQFPFVNSFYISAVTKNCPIGFGTPSGKSYVIAQGTHGSFISQADADLKAQQDADANAQAWVDAHNECVAEFEFIPCCAWSSPSNNFSLSGTGNVNFTFKLYYNSGSPYGKIATLTGPAVLPYQIRTVTVNSEENDYVFEFYPNGDVKLISGNLPNHVIEIIGSYPL